MAVPSTNVKFSDIYAEANGAYSSGIISLNTMSFFSYFAGPNGSNSQAANNWGQGEGSGANRIYGTSAKTTNIQVGDFDGLTYFYDNSTFQVTLAVTNNLPPAPPPPPPAPPPPPGSNDVDVNIELYDSSFSYQYIAGGGPAAENGGTFGPSSISQTDDPIIFRGYWKVTISGMPNPFFTGGSCDISINGTAKVTGGIVSTAPGGSTFDSVTYGTEDVAIFGGFTGLYFEVTVY
jgi:hypothetical protein